MPKKPVARTSSYLRTCYVCQKLVYPNMMGFSAITHPRCKPGTKKWLDYFERLPEKDRTEAGKLIYMAKKRKAETKVIGRKLAEAKMYEIYNQLFRKGV